MHAGHWCKSFVQCRVSRRPCPVLEHERLAYALCTHDGAPVRGCPPPTRRLRTHDNVDARVSARRASVAGEAVRLCRYSAVTHLHSAVVPCTARQPGATRGCRRGCRRGGVKQRRRSRNAVVLPAADPDPRTPDTVPRPQWTSYIAALLVLIGVDRKVTRTRGKSSLVGTDLWYCTVPRTVCFRGAKQTVS